MAKVTMQDIADALGISRVSVWKVFNNAEGVSPALRERVLDKASEIGYERVTQLQSESMKGSETNIAVLVSRPESSAFWGTIIHSLAGHLTQKANANLLYIYVPAEWTPGYVLPESVRRGLVSGVIALNVYDAQMLSLINQAPCEKIFLDIPTSFPVEELKGSLVLIEGRRTTKAITADLISKGMTRIGFIGDTRYALTNKLRYEGYVEAMRENQLVFDESYLFSEKIGINEYYSRIAGYLDTVDDYPEAYVCVSDFVASFVYEYFLEHKSRLKKPIVVTGYDGSVEYPLVSGKITTADVRPAALGRILGIKMMERLGNKGLPREVSYVFPEIMFRGGVLAP